MSQKKLSNTSCNKGSPLRTEVSKRRTTTKRQKWTAPTLPTRNAVGTSVSRAHLSSTGVVRKDVFWLSWMLHYPSLLVSTECCCCCLFALASIIKEEKSFFYRSKSKISVAFLDEQCLSCVYISDVAQDNANGSDKQQSPVYLPWPPWAMQHK